MHGPTWVKNHDYSGFSRSSATIVSGVTVFQSGCLSRLKAAATPSIMLPYLLLSSASFALPIPIRDFREQGVGRQIRASCVKVEGHENVDPTQGTKPLDKPITARICFKRNSLIFTVAKPADLVDGGQMFLQAPTEEQGVIIKCRTPFFRRTPVCRRKYDHVTAGNYELKYNGRKVVFKVAPTGNPKPVEPLRLASSGAPKPAAPPPPSHLLKDCVNGVMMGTICVDRELLPKVQ
jgi:hypothetical protein